MITFQLLLTEFTWNNLNCILLYPIVVKFSTSIMYTISQLVFALTSRIRAWAYYTVVLCTHLTYESSLIGIEIFYTSCFSLLHHFECQIYTLVYKNCCNCWKYYAVRQSYISRLISHVYTLATLYILLLIYS